MLQGGVRSQESGPPSSGSTFRGSSPTHPTNQRPRLPMMMQARPEQDQRPDPSNRAPPPMAMALDAAVVDAAFISAAAAPVVDGADRGVKHSAFACVRAHACTHPIHSHHPMQT